MARGTSYLFKPGEAEEMVVELRGHLRAAADHRDVGAEADVGQEQSASDALLKEILTRLNRRFDRYAKKKFGGRPQEMVEDAIMEMHFAVIRDLRDLRPQAAHYEQGFNQCVERAMLDAVKKVRRENDLDAYGHHKAGDAEPISLETPLPNGDESDTAQTLADRIDDPKAAFPFDAVECERLLSHLPSDNHRLIFRDFLNGELREESATRAGISVRTATNYIKQSSAILRSLMTPRD